MPLSSISSGFLLALVVAFLAMKWTGREYYVTALSVRAFREGDGVLACIDCVDRSLRRGH
jgi:hypothetical protein